MKTVSVIVATLSAISMNAQLAQAGNAGESLPACYNHVINACNQSDHPEACAEAGMNACDDLHSANLVPDVPLNLNYATRRDGTYIFYLRQVDSAEPAMPERAESDTAGR